MPLNNAISSAMALANTQMVCVDSDSDTEADSDTVFSTIFANALTGALRNEDGELDLPEPEEIGMGPKLLANNGSLDGGMDELSDNFMNFALNGSKSYVIDTGTGTTFTSDGTVESE